MRFPLFVLAGFLAFHFSFNKSIVFENNQPPFFDPIEEECLTDILLQQKLNADTVFKSHHEEIENRARQFFKNQLNNNEGQEKMDYTLPVVFHIVHQNGSENIPDADILLAVDQLNDAFANINFYDQGVGVDTRIDFCLAKRDPDGNATTGINRVVSPLTNLNMSQDLQLKNLIRWDPHNYINIWLVKNINGAAGYAYLPASHGGPEDGIVMLSEILTTLGGGHSTLVHEMGHYLGLYHTFQGGCVNNDCLINGDRVCDTPPDGSTAPPPGCVSVVNSCDTDINSGFTTDENDLYWNYVDYGNHACRAGYSQGQTDRMVYFIENVRHSLLESQACLDPCFNPFDASFAASASTINLGESIIFTNTSTGGNNFEWQINGVPFSTNNNASYLFNDGDGIYEITLIANNGDPNCESEFSMEIEVRCPTEASFTASTLNTIAGGTVDFYNNSTDANNHEWQVNGVNFSNNVNPSYTFNNLGNYEIKLIATHPSGNCADEFILFVQVDCVVASFETGNLYPGPGDVVNFINTTQGASSYTWSVNNSVESTSTDLNYNFSAAGIYNVCLEAANGFCTDNYCQQIFVFENTDGECTSTFIKRIGNTDVNEENNDFIISADGNFYITGKEGDRSFILKIDQSGEILAKRSFNITSGDDFISCLIEDSEGYLIGAARDQQNSTTINYFFKYDWVSDNFMWVKNLTDPAWTRIDRVIENTQNGNYIFYGLTNPNSNDAYMVELDNNSGAPQWQRRDDYGGNTDIFGRGTIYNGELFSAGVIRLGGGLDDIRPAIFNLDLNGNLNWTKMYISPASFSSRLYFTDLSIDNNEIIAVCRGVLNGSDLIDSRMQIVKTNMAGEIIWAKEYYANGTNSFAGQQIHEIPDGYIVSGYFNENNGTASFFFLKVDKNGNPIWAKKIDTGSADGRPVFEVVNNHIYFAAFTEAYDTGSNRDLLFGKINLDGEVTSDGCDLVSGFLINEIILFNPFEQVRVPNATYPNFVYHNADIGSEINNMVTNEINGCECDEFSSGCENSTFVKIIGEENENEIGYSIIPSNDGNVYLSGSIGTKSLLIKMDVSGNPIWQRTFQFSNGRDVVTEIMVDSENNIVGSGYGWQPNFDDYAAFAFKYDPINDNVIWSRQFAPHSRAYGILEPKPGSDYLIYLNNGSTAWQNGVMIYLDRNNGNESGALNQQYDLGTAQTFNSTILYNNELYVAGRYTNGGGSANMRWSVSNFDLNGNEDWSRLSFTALNNSARLYARDIIEDGGALYSTGGGDDNGTSTTQTNIFLQKNTINGNLDWVRKYDVLQYNNEWGEEVVSTSDGFLLYGHNRENPGQLFLIKTDKDGNALWAKSYGGAGHENNLFTVESNILVAGNFIYFISETSSFGGDQDIVLFKTDSEGNLQNECMLVEDLDVVMTNIGNPANASATLDDSPAQMVSNSTQVSPADLSVTFADAEGCECEEIMSGCENSSFVKIVGEENKDETGTCIIPTGDGNLFIAGRSGARSLITKMDVAGNYIWQRSFQFSALNDLIIEIIIDADGYLVGCGFGENGAPSNNNATAFIFKYDPVNDIVLWVKRFTAKSLAIGVLDIEPPNGDYLVYMIRLSNNTDGHLVKLDRNTGNITNLFSDYRSSATENFQDVIAVNNSLYLTGRYTDGNAVAGYRFGLSRFDFNGNEDWSKLTFIPTGMSARLYASDIMEENNFLYTFGAGDDDGISALVTDLFLQKSDLNGEPEWVVKYSVPSMANEWSSEIVSVPDGFLLYGVDRNPPGDLFIIKTDKNGNVLWAKSYGGAGHEFTRPYFKSQLIAGGNFIYLVASTDSYGGDEDILLIKTDGEGNINDDCIVVNDLEVNTTVNNNPTSNATSFYTANPSIFISTVQATSFNENILSEDVDGCECTPAIDTCANGAPLNLVPDAVMQFINAKCNGENMTVEFQVCNNDSVALPINTPISIYNSDPALINAQLIDSVEMTDSLLPGDCDVFIFELNIPINQELFAVVNDNGTTPTPFNLANDFPNTLIEECDYTNNINNFQIDFTPPVLDLGPDVKACDFGVIDLDAGPGFATYLWSDATTEQITTAWQPGIYWVEVTDSCGSVQVDSILLQVEPASIVEIGMDTVEICEGDSVTFSVNGFNSYQWVPSEYLNCDTCATVIAKPDTTITYILVAGEGDGCISEDTVTIVTAPALMSFDTISFCTGDTVLIFGNEVTEAGDYSESYATGTGCDSVHTTTLLEANDTILLIAMMSVCAGDSVEFFGTWLDEPGNYEYFDNSSSCVEHTMLDLIVHDTFFNADTIYLCEGDSVLIFGNYESEEGVFTVTLPSAFGCDSTEQIRLFLSDTIFTNELIEICANETADIFGAQISAPGIYSENYSTVSGCDSLHEIELIVHGIYSVSDTIDLCAGDSVLIFGNYETQAGVYSNNFTSVNGCDSITNILVELLDTFFTSEIIEICANENADIFGTPINTAGIYSQTFMAENGCDSTHAMQLIVHDTFLTEEFVEICFGDSIFIFGNYETQSGVYSELNQSIYGCDSLSVIYLETAEEIILEMSSTPACAGADVGSVSVNVSGGVAPFNFNWNIPNAPNGGKLNNIPPGTYSVTVTDANNCAAMATAEVEALSEINIAINSGDVTCPGDSDGAAVIFVNIDNPSFSLDGINFQDLNVFDNLSVGDYTVTVADSNTGCSAEAPFTISEPPPVVVNLPPDITIELGDEINITSSSTQIINNYLWTPDQWINCNDCPGVIAQPESTILYTLNVLDENGCPGADSILITVEFNPRVFIPSAFSPNNDGINDLFFPYSDGVAEIKLMRIFNRWGGMVYEAANFQPNDATNGWDGTFKGKKLNPAVFVYFVQVVYADGTEALLEGDLTLIR